MSALGQLLGGSAAPGGGGGNPDDLLNQILQLMQQYLALGQDTPAFGPISEALPAIEEAVGGAAPDSEDSADMASEPGGEPPAEVGTPPVGPDNPMQDMQPSSPPSSFGDASAQALDAMTKKKKGKGAY